MDANENDKENCGIRVSFSQLKDGKGTPCMDKQIELEHLFVSLDDIVNRELWRMFPAINCNFVEDIPIDYPGPIGVPITYLIKHDQARFEILDCIRPKINGKDLYRRILIRNLHPTLPETVDLVEWFDRMGEKIEVLVEE